LYSGSGDLRGRDRPAQALGDEARKLFLVARPRQERAIETGIRELGDIISDVPGRADQRITAQPAMKRYVAMVATETADPNSTRDGLAPRLNFYYILQ
jgi:hypothetical protein